MTIDNPRLRYAASWVVHSSCPARCILPAISRAGTWTTLMRGLTHGCFFGGNTALLSAPYLESPFRNNYYRLQRIPM